MIPYYSEAGITIYHGDCRDVIPSLPDQRVIVADPPYMFHLHSTEGKMGWGDMMNGAVWYASWLSEIRRLTANLQGCCWVFNSWRSWPVLARAGYIAEWNPESLLVWDKQWIGPGGTKGLRPSHEFAALFCQPAFALKNRSLPDIWRCKWQGGICETEHRAEKPVELFMRLISESGDGPVLDPFLGSGTTLVAAKRLGRPAIGIEIEEKYCELAALRLSQGVIDLVGEGG